MRKKVDIPSKGKKIKKNDSIVENKREEVCQTWGELKIITNHLSEYEEVLKTLRSKSDELRPLLPLCDWEKKGLLEPPVISDETLNDKVFGKMKILKVLVQQMSDSCDRLLEEREIALINLREFEEFLIDIRKVNDGKDHEVSE